MSSTRKKTWGPWIAGTVLAVASVAAVLVAPTPSEAFPGNRIIITYYSAEGVYCGKYTEKCNGSVTMDGGVTDYYTIFEGNCEF